MMQSIYRSIQAATVLFVIVFTGSSGLSQNLPDSSEDKSAGDSVVLSTNDLRGELDTLLIIDHPVPYAENERGLFMANVVEQFLLDQRSTRVESLSVYDFLYYLDRKFEDVAVLVVIGEDEFELEDIEERFKYQDTILRRSEFLYQHESGKYSIKVVIN